uniref:Uncharacterized protein n=1 Tax=Poecilia mexicana TaxID=48701 RepID=A0A3B3XKZ7_9TELE
MCDVNRRAVPIRSLTLGVQQPGHAHCLLSDRPPSLPLTRSWEPSGECLETAATAKKCRAGGTRESSAAKRTQQKHRKCEVQHLNAEISP